MQFSQKLAVIAASVALTMALAACGPQQGAGGGPGDRWITIGISFDRPGLGLKEGETYTGFDVAVARYVAKELGYGGDQVRFVEVPLDRRETMVQAHQVKFVVADYAMTAARRQEVSFAGPYFVAGQDLLVRENADITGPDTLNGHTLCSVIGSPSASNIVHNYASRVRLRKYDTYSECVDALNRGTIDAVSTDNLILAGFAAEPQFRSRLKVVGKPFTTERYGIAVMKGDTETCLKVNMALDKMILDGSWRSALDQAVGGSGFQPDPTKNPPKPGTCS